MGIIILIEHLSSVLKEKGVRASYQRIRILEAVSQKDTHPTVDEIFRLLSSEIPSLAKATIYNTLHTFVDAGLVRVVSIDGDELRYDSVTANHGHFKCNSCGTIYNFRIEIDSIPYQGLNQFEIAEKNVYFSGLCPKCLI